MIMKQWRIVLMSSSVSLGAYSPQDVLRFFWLFVNLWPFIVAMTTAWTRDMYGTAFTHAQYESSSGFDSSPAARHPMAHGPISNPVSRFTFVNRNGRG